MGLKESQLALALSHFLDEYLRTHNVGRLSGGDGFYEILRDQVRGPDLAFVSWETMRTPSAELPANPAVAPDLVCEVLSPSNRTGEMSRKLQEYFDAGVKLVWYIDPDTRSARAFVRPEEGTLITEQQSLSGGEVLPGLEVKLAELFQRALPEPPAN